MNKKPLLPKKLEDLPTSHGEETHEPSYEEMKIKDLEATIEALQAELNSLNAQNLARNEQINDNEQLKLGNEKLLNNYDQVISKQSKEIEQLKLDNARLVRDKQEIEDSKQLLKKSGLYVDDKLHFMERIAVQSPFVVNRFRVVTGWIYTFQTPTGLTSVLETDSK